MRPESGRGRGRHLALKFDIVSVCAGLRAQISRGEMDFMNADFGNVLRSGARAAAIVAAVLALCGPVVHAAAGAGGDELSGKEVVEAVCAGCHATGANGAPKIGDKQAWSKREMQGLTALSEHALEGIRNMPSHGGNPNLTDLEITRAVTYMVDQSGGKWQEPIDREAPPAERSGAQIVKTQCSKCHQDGKGGAPRIGDLEAWIPRLKQGLDTLVMSAIRGHGGMPARGGMANLTDAELKGAIIYLFRGPAAGGKH
jgi:cytochrome c5